MTAEMLIQVLKLLPPETDMFVCDPDKDADYFVDRIKHDVEECQAFIITSH